MPRKPSNPFDLVADRILNEVVFPALEDRLFPMMDEMFASIPRKGRKRMRVDAAYYERRNRNYAPPPSWGYVLQQRVLTPTLYDTLQVSRKADVETIQAAWKSLCFRFHPDRNPGDQRAAERMIQINQAWETLGDAQKRAAYDRTLA